jgi:predicted nucleic acid-binding protein
MIVVDTSVWVDHLRHGNTRLAQLLVDNRVLVHPAIIGELACGNLRNRAEILSLLASLPQAKEADHAEVLQFLDMHRLFGQGLGWVDAHILAAAVLTHAELWTRDRAMRSAALRLGIAAA